MTTTKPKLKVYYPPDEVIRRETLGCGDCPERPGHLGCPLGCAGWMMDKRKNP